MNKPSGLDLIDQIVVARLLVAGEKGATTSELKKSLEPLLGHRFAGGLMVQRLTQALASLEAAGLVHRTRKGTTARGMLTAKGRHDAIAFLGLDHLPPKTTWSQITKSYLTAKSLKLPTPGDRTVKHVSSDTGFKAALLKSQFALALDDCPTLDQALDALAWKLLGFEAAPGVKFNVKAVKAAVLRRELEGSKQVDPRADPRRVVTMLLAKKVGARQSARDELRLATLRYWIDEMPAAPATTLVPARVSRPFPDLGTFAQRVITAARACRTGRFGDDKVFIVHVFRHLSVDPTFAAMGLDKFKQRLAEANNARLLDLSRANMVEAMNQSDVEPSRVSYLGAEFHFIRIPTP
jgi:hypothetical protein